MPTPLIIPSHLVVAPTDLSGGGTALSTYRRRLADELGFYLQTTVSAAATTGEAQRIVLSDELRDDEDGTDLGATWLYVRTGAQAGAQRRIIRGPATGYQGYPGAVMVSRQFASPLGVGDEVELTAPLGVKRYLSQKGLDDIVNEALERTWISARLSIDGDGSNTYPLPGYAYLQLADAQRIGVADRADGTNYARRGAERAQITGSGPERILVTEGRHSSGETVGLDVVVRADRLIYNGMAWTYVADDGVPGLHHEDEKAAAPESWVLAVSMLKALQQTEKVGLHLDRSASAEARQEAVSESRARRAQWAAAAAAIKRWEMPKANLGPQVPFVSVSAEVAL